MCWQGQRKGRWGLSSKWAQCFLGILPRLATVSSGRWSSGSPTRCEDLSPEPDGQLSWAGLGKGVRILGPALLGANSSPSERGSAAGSRELENRRLTGGQLGQRVETSIL